MFSSFPLISTYEEIALHFQDFRENAKMESTIIEKKV